MYNTLCIIAKKGTITRGPKKIQISHSVKSLYVLIDGAKKKGAEDEQVNSGNKVNIIQHLYYFILYVVI